MFGYITCEQYDMLRTITLLMKQYKIDMSLQILLIVIIIIIINQVIFLSMDHSYYFHNFLSFKTWLPTYGVKSSHHIILWSASMSFMLLGILSVTLIVHLLSRLHVSTSALLCLFSSMFVVMPIYGSSLYSFCSWGWLLIWFSSSCFGLWPVSNRWS